MALSFSTSMTQVLLIYGVLMSPANVLLGPTAAAALLTRWFSRKRGAALGIAAAGISAGGILFPPLIQFLIDTLEWRTAFLTLSGIIFLLTVPAILLIVVDRPAVIGISTRTARRPPKGLLEPGPAAPSPSRRAWCCATSTSG